MKASMLDLRRRTREVLSALERNEAVGIYYRGKIKGVLYPAGNEGPGRRSVFEHPAFGMWKDRPDLAKVEAAVRKLRKGRPHAF
jgi:hypothetical protein